MKVDQPTPDTLPFNEDVENIQHNHERLNSTIATVNLHDDQLKDLLARIEKLEAAAKG